MPNLYGDIISDLCAGLIGGLGLTPSANIGEPLADDMDCLRAMHDAHVKAQVRQPEQHTCSSYRADGADVF